MLQPNKKTLITQLIQQVENEQIKNADKVLKDLFMIDSNLNLYHVINEMMYSYSMYVMSDTNYCGDENNDAPNHLYALKLLRDAVFPMEKVLKEEQFYNKNQ